MKYKFKNLISMPPSINIRKRKGYITPVDYSMIIRNAYHLRRRSFFEIEEFIIMQTPFRTLYIVKDIKILSRVIGKKDAELVINYFKEQNK